MTKKKSSFRIDDLLQHQAHESDAPRAHFHRQIFTSLMQTTSNKAAEQAQVQLSKNHRYVGHSAITMPSVPHLHRIVKEMLNDTMPSSSSNETSTPKADNPQTMTSIKSSGGHTTTMHAAYAELPPHKPMPMYAPPIAQPAPMSVPANLLDMNKTNYCFTPMPMTMTPPFSHAATAYLEHYANTFHKGEYTPQIIVPNKLCSLCHCPKP